MSTEETNEFAKGWIQATPLENYSSLHELSLGGLMGLNWPLKHFYVQLNFNLHTPFQIHNDASLIIQVIDDNRAPEALERCFATKPFNRWRLDITPYGSFEELIYSRIRWSRNNYKKTEKIFNDYGGKVTFIEEDWTHLVPKVYELYRNVAKRHGDKLYDIHFFTKTAKRKDYKLLCAWFEEKLIGMSLLQEELPTLHSTCCGLDYEHSSKSYAYSWMHYQLLRHAMESNKYHNVDIGLTADEFKKMIGFEPVSVRMDIYSKGLITRNLLKFASLFISASITSEGKLKFSL